MMFKGRKEELSTIRTAFICFVLSYLILTMLAVWLVGKDILSQIYANGLIVPGDILGLFPMCTNIHPFSFTF